MITVNSAAIRDHDGTVYAPGRPCRHEHIMRMMAGMGIKTPITGKQGFVLSDGRFVDRREAVIVAIHAGQVEGYRKELYSEDIY